MLATDKITTCECVTLLKCVAMDMQKWITLTTEL